MAGSTVDTTWLACDPHHPPVIDFDSPPDLIIIQCAVRWHNLHALGWDRLRCPIIASCGDASPLCNTAAVFANLPLLSRLYVVGQDYIDKYLQWSINNRIEPTPEKLHYQHLCADNHFQPLPQVPKVYDWCFLGQAYQPYDVRLKHYRRALIPNLLGVCPNAYVSGPGWAELIGDRSHGDWIDQSYLNAIYNQSLAVVSIDAHDGAGYTSTRTIEAMHAGHCVLIYDHPGMAFFKRDVRDGRHALYFDSPDSFKDKIKEMKAEPRRALAIGAAARQLVLDKGWTVTAWMTQCLGLV